MELNDLLTGLGLILQAAIYILERRERNQDK